MWRQPGWTGVGVGGGEGKILFQKGAKGSKRQGEIFFGRKSFGGGEMIVGRKTVQRGGELLGIGGKVEKAAGSKQVLQVHREKYDRYHTLVTFNFLRSIYRKFPFNSRTLYTAPSIPIPQNHTPNYASASRYSPSPPPHPRSATNSSPSSSVCKN